MNDMSEALLRSLLGGRPFRYFESIGSTNDAALAWLRDHPPSGAVVIADEQTEGRGRLGRKWHTPPNAALALSYIFYPDATSLNRVSMLGSWAVCRLLEAYAVELAGIKWPNDVQIGKRKVCGVLPQAVWDNGKLLGVVLGIGLNVRVQFDAALSASAVNLEEALGRALNRAQLLSELLGYLDAGAQEMHTAEWLNHWASRLNTLGQRVRVEDVEGIAHSIDSDGALLLRLDDGSVRRVLAGDVLLT